MSPWKVILATMIIFACGVITGSLLTRNLENPPHAVSVAPAIPITSTNARMAAMPPFTMQPDFLRRLDRQLELTPQQHDDIARIIKTSHKRTQGLWEQIAPQMTGELKRVREEISLVLTPEQRKRWTEMRRHKPEPAVPSNARPAALEQEHVPTNSTNP